MGALLVVLAVVAAVGLALGLRRAERRTFTFPEPVRRVEADWQGLRLPGGEVSYRVEVPTR